MSIELVAIIFNHNPFSASSDALNIRQNFQETILFPEWQRGLSVNPRDSLAAYALEETRGNTITIKAQFARTNSGINVAEIRAIDLQGQLPGLQSNVLGRVKARLVFFQGNGETEFELFELQDVRIWSRGVGIQNIIWRWQFRLDPSQPWTDFATSEHKIYTLLAVPTLPWQQIPDDFAGTQLPWTDVMDFACRWANREFTLNGAAGQVTRAVFDLGAPLGGPRILEYGCANDGFTTYAILDSFNCTAFLDLLRGGLGRGPFVNCTDCATIVSTFANVLGCDLWQSKMLPPSPFTPGFTINLIIPIGFRTWTNACGRPAFVYHEVPWLRDCIARDAIFDACLQVNGNFNPSAPPRFPLLPINMIFGNIGDNLYRDRLADPAGRPNCVPAPFTRKRRRVI